MAATASLETFLLGLPDIGKLTPQNHVLLVAHHLRTQGVTHFSKKELSSHLSSAGMPIPRDLESRLKRLAVGKTPGLVRVDIGRYSLSLFGVQEVQKYLNTVRGISHALDSLQKLVGRLPDTPQQEFYAEVVACVQVGSRRAAIVMAWLLVMDHMQRYAIKHKLADFNAALSKRTDAKGLVISVQEDFARLRDEKTQIETMYSGKVISKAVRKILSSGLDFRNDCAHPSDVDILENKVVVHIEDWVYNVLLKHSL